MNYTLIRNLESFPDILVLFLIKPNFINKTQAPSMETLFSKHNNTAKMTKETAASKAKQIR